MSSIRDWLRSVAKREESLSTLALDTLRTTFQARYHHFKLLLSANNKALEIMAELQEARSGENVFGMYFIHSRCTAVCVNVLRAIENLNELAPGKYSGLNQAFRSIEGKIRETVLSAKRPMTSEPMVIPIENLDVAEATLAGNKLANLGEIRKRLGIKVPNGFVISSRAYRDFMGTELPEEIDRLMQTSSGDKMHEIFQLSTRIQQQIIQNPVPAEVEKAILNGYDGLKEREGQNLRVSMRSSAVGEDSSRTSHAGLYRSELNVSREDLLQAYRDVVASKFTPQAMIYRLNRGVRDDDVDMCVGCMSMVNAVAGGVVYSRNPLDEKDKRVHIHSTYGLPVGVVDGNAGEDLWVVDREPLRIAEMRLGVKREKFVAFPEEGIRRIEISATLPPSPSISDSTALELAKIALQIEKHYGCTQDIEWALNETGEIVVLQCRPVAQSERMVGPKRKDIVLGASRAIAFGGVTASPGAAAGPVFVVRTESDMLSFPAGAVLVVKQALPRWAAVLSRATAFIAEQGSTAGHLANVAREFGVPGVVGLEGATKWLENGRSVSVDADGGRVCEGSIEPWLEKRQPPRRLMEGSPVLDTLNKVVKYISPLNLLDPQALNFQPSSCRSLHDITRFCHEMAVLEMFSFGKDHKFSEKSSKQLVCGGVAMQWWVLDLDDGFKSDIAGKSVNLEDIASIPMLALWKGIVAVPWPGPPALQPGSLVAIMLESARDPAMEPSLPSPYKSRNYFMISRNFCSLASRFGYHLSNVEALVSERANENYVSFSFQGGAADYARRVRRVHLVVSILNEFGFHSEVRGDSVSARAEGEDADRMVEKLRILGYLLIHTRQLDLALSHEQICAEWKQKLLSDISNILLLQSPDRVTHT